jgi:hypothetical protein
MSKKVIGLEHNSISPDITGIENQYSVNLHLERGINKNLTVYVDESMRNVDFKNSKYNVGFLVEPETVASGLYKWIQSNHDRFDMILTHHKPLLEINPKFKYYPVWPRIKMDRQYWNLYEKPLNVSAIFSNKQVTEPQKFRHIIAERFKNKIDLYGTGFQFLEDKIHGTGNYKYQVVVENIFSGYTSEKANDCFACGTIPIYYGDEKSNINDYYNKEGFILFKTLDELEHILDNIINEKYYSSKIEIIKENYNLAINNNVHTTLWNNGIKEFFNE